ncbi:MAG: M28 family peptidase, partial [Turicibacter sp.]
MFQTHTFTHPYPASLDTHLQQIAKDVHPVGSPENKQVGDYIITQIPTAYAITTQEFEIEGVPMRNIFAFKDNNSTDTIAIASHYDSAIGSYGAGDAGLAIASMLSNTEEFANTKDKNILLMFMDGEEGLHIDKHSHTKDRYLFGSRYFAQNYDREFGEIQQL